MTSPRKTSYVKNFMVYSNYGTIPYCHTFYGDTASLPHPIKNGSSNAQWRWGPGIFSHVGPRSVTTLYSRKCNLTGGKKVTL